MNSHLKLNKILAIWRIKHIQKYIVHGIQVGHKTILSPYTGWSQKSIGLQLVSQE